MARLKNPRTWITWLAALAVLGGLLRLALDDRRVAFAVREPTPPKATAKTPPATEVASHAAAAFAPVDR